MRLDKFLKVARVIKRRTVANKACSGQRVLINGKDAKPAKTIKEGDIITVFFGNRKYTIKVKSVPSGNIKKEQTGDLFEVIESDNEF
ncbi:MAG: RNA-binding S4 domain-containing protein [Bacillota bacterium]